MSAITSSATTLATTPVRHVIAEFKDNKIIYSFNAFTEEQIKYILSALVYTNHVISEVNAKIGKNYRIMLRHSLRHIRLHPSSAAFLDFIGAIQRRIDVCRTKDGTGVGNATAAALTASGIQGAFNQKRITGAATSSVGDNPLFDTIRAKQKPNDEGASISYIDQISFDTAYSRIDQLKESKTFDFLKIQFAVDTALELNIPQWWHAAHLATRYKKTYQGMGLSDNTVFMRLQVDMGAMYRCRVSMTELAIAIEGTKLLEKAEVQFVAIPSPTNIGFIDLVVLNITKYVPYERTPSFIPGYSIKELQHRHILSIIRESIYYKTTASIRGIPGVTNVEVLISNVEHAVYDINIVNDHEDLRYGPIPDEADPKVVVVYGNSGPTTDQAGALAITSLDRVPKGISVLHATTNGSYLPGSVPMQIWRVVIAPIYRVLHGVNVIHILRLLYKTANRRLYIEAYNVLTMVKSITSVEKILLDPSRYHISGDRFIPNSRVEEFDIIYPGNVRDLLINSVIETAKVNKSSEVSPLYVIRHRTYGRSIYNLILNDDNVDRNMTVYSNVNVCVNLWGIEAAVSASIMIMIYLEDKINPQHPVLYSYYRALSGNIIALMSNKAASKVGPITGGQLDNAISTFARASDRMRESTSTTAGFICSGYNTTEVKESDYPYGLNIYGMPEIPGTIAMKFKTIQDAGFEPYVDNNKPSDELIDITSSMGRANQYNYLPTITINSVDLIDIDLVYRALNKRVDDPINSFIVIPIAVA